MTAMQGAHYVLHLISLIHLFILNFYIEPLQEKYPEALPTPAWLERAVLRREKNAGERILLIIRSSERWPTTKIAWICLVEVWAKGRRRRPCRDERSDRELIAQRRGQCS